MNPIYVPLVAALAGAIVGSLSSIAAIFIQASVGARRERMRVAALMAMDEYKTHAATMKAGKLMPFSTYLYHHLALFDAIEEDDLTPERLREIAAKNDELLRLSIELDDEWRRTSGAQQK